MTSEYIPVLVPVSFVTFYCTIQSVVNFRGRRYVLGAAGVISALLALIWLVTFAYNAAVLAGAVSPVRIVN